ncbi:unnamed protein product [Mytilus edulis]|uniref:Uncharacterized protein n=1 Tax=Mytilus edulis TaxID=6550 RepID=A0A8S3QSY3_MYTED|nr:unnamed protein product [Mytilus edulis]
MYIKKEKVNTARTRAKKQEAQNKHQLLNKEVKKCCRKDKREYVNDLATEAEFTAYKGDIKTLYNITKTLSKRKTAKSKPVKDKDGKFLTNLNEQMERWNEYFINVLNRPEPDQPVRVEPAGVPSETGETISQPEKIKTQEAGRGWIYLKNSPK